MFLWVLSPEPRMDDSWARESRYVRWLDADFQLNADGESVKVDKRFNFDRPS